MAAYKLVKKERQAAPSEIQQVLETNSTVVAKKSKEELPLISGIPVDAAVKRIKTPPVNKLSEVASEASAMISEAYREPVRVGVSIGATFNMGDYESLRVEAWLQDTTRENETAEQAFARLTDLVSNHVESLHERFVPTSKKK